MLKMRATAMCKLLTSSSAIAKMTARPWFKKYYIKILLHNGHFTIQGHSRSPILVPIERQYMTSCLLIIIPIVISRTVSKLLPIIGTLSGYFVRQGHSRSPILVPVGSS